MARVRTYETPTVMKHGLGAVDELAGEVRRLGIRRPLVVTDKGIVQSGLAARATEVLDRGGVEHRVFAGVVPNPAVELIGIGSEVYRTERCDGLIAIGGGSSIDTAKAVGVEAVHGGRSIINFEYGRDPLDRRIPPLIAIPTTAGTGSEVTLWAVITDPQRRIKFNVGGPEIAAHVALVDPLLHLGLPAHLTASTGMDAFTHAVECFTCAYAQPQTDAFALLAIEYLSRFLRVAYAQGQNVEARYRCAMGAMLAGLSYGSESAGAVHAMSQTAGGYYDVPHGVLTAAILPWVMEYNWMGEPEKFARIALAMGEDIRGLSLEAAAQRAVAAVWRLVDDLQIPSLGEIGIRDADVPELARLAFEDPQTIGNPRDLDLGAYERIYRRALENARPR
ncbi:MAG: iron-containing alcohol dehydrogenase [Chloroflexi bacterium]|nr:iron-containing alcohol dehydrogenase [Chloroflexota bacterium]